MGQIIFDQYLTAQGLTEKNFRAALNISNSELAGHTLSIKLVKKRSKHKKRYWAINIFLDDKPKGITIGISGSKISVLQQTISVLKAPNGKKRRGVWPKNQPLLKWLEEQQRELLTPADKKQQKESVIKQNILPISLQLVEKFQNKMPELHTLKTAYHVLQQYHFKKYKPLENQLYAVIAYRKADWAARAVAATKEKKQIFLWDSRKHLILKMDTAGKQMEYQSIFFSLEHIRAACSQVEIFKAEMAEKMFEERIARLLAQIPNRLDTHIKALQQKAEQQWDKISLLNARDLIFLQGYNHPRFNFYKELKANIQTEARMEGWIAAWIGRVEKAIAAPSRVDATTQTILKLIATSRKYGIKTYAMWLGNSNANVLLGKKLNIECYHALKNSYTIAAIAAKIEALIGYQWLKRTTVGAYLPVLVITETGKKLLQLLEQKKIKVTAAQPATVAPQPAMTVVDVHSHLHWLTEIQQHEHSAYVSFLNSPQSVANIADWTEDEVAAMQRMLNERLEGWQVLAQWKLSQHPVKYKLLQRLLTLQ